MRKGVIALGKIEAERVREKMLAAPRADRLRLMRATEANFGHIVTLHDDPAWVADQAFDMPIDGLRTIIEATDVAGNALRVWRITDSTGIEPVWAALADKDLYIVNGHRRCETVANFVQEGVYGDRLEAVSA